MADGHLTVTRDMKQDLSRKGFASIQACLDRPRKLFRAFKDDRILSRLGISKGSYIITTATSWTKDEDFDLFFKALTHLDGDFVVVITGKGPLRDFYMRRAFKVSLILLVREI